MADTAAPRDWQNPWIWTLVALLIGLAMFANFARPADHEASALDWALMYGRTGAGTGVPSSTAAPDELKGKL